MQLKAALLACLTSTVLFFVAACGGGSTSNDPAPTQPGNSGGGNTSAGSGSASGSPSGSGTGTSGSGGTTASCQPQTVVGGNLSVVEQGSVGVTLLSTGGLSQYTFTFLYDNVFGIATNNPQDKWGSTTLFPPGTPVGASAQVQLQPFSGFVNGEQTPSTFPKGIPIELWLTISDGNQPGPTNSSSTASIGKDLLGHDQWHTASVTYTTSTTATVTFFSQGGAAFSVGLTNVSGQASPSGC